MDSAVLDTAPSEAYPAQNTDAPNKGVPHLRGYEVADILRWSAQGLTQQQIALRLEPPRTQKTVSECLARVGPDNSTEAKRILRGGAADMAWNILRKGLPRDHVATLKGIGVLEDVAAQGFTVNIGVTDSAVQVVIVAPGSSAE